MKSLFFSALLLLTVGACQSEVERDVQPENADWYILKAPDARAIEGVYGDIDGTLVITTGYKIYQTTDRGKTWRATNYSSNRGLFGFVQVADTLLVLNTQSTNSSDPATPYANTPSYFSVNQGATWQPYRNWRRDSHEPQIARNKINTSSGTEYYIDIARTPSSTPSGSYLETIGIATSKGDKILLPQAHQITSLYLDAKSRLCVTASAPLCGRNENFAFCGDQNGVLYITKNPQR
ncbi:hypothetical protein [Hymenobacter fodinae]|uniref:Uncharacterized protein n=1 Tax=Hymenobacter fodinae TaxID=2510796 RepID=A0A4Z0P1K5_9BACT|nr:hypothetical protein [Hymenobacter fodinae]TGE03804.1 hypothetical protein EU556_24655 [Hymenobacter fodinae]